MTRAIKTLTSTFYHNLEHSITTLDILHRFPVTTNHKSNLPIDERRSRMGIEKFTCLRIHKLQVADTESEQ